MGAMCPSGERLPSGQSGIGPAPDKAWSAYDSCMATFHDELREHVAMFFTNWRNPNYTVPQKIGLTIKNRAIGLVNGGCCGNHGQPGC